MRQLLPFVPLFISCLLLEASQPFHIYSPSSKENTLWIVKATPNGESLSLKVAQRVNFRQGKQAPARGQLRERPAQCLPA